MNVADLTSGQKDAAGAIVLTVYVKCPPKFAVYRTSERVLIHFADDPAAAAKQCADLNPLTSVRGEINGLIDTWREQADIWRGAAKAARYDRLVADELTIALQGDVAGAVSRLAKIKDDILGERVATARFWYLIAAVITGLAGWLVFRGFSGVEGATQTTIHLLTAATAGLLGAFFSIALIIRERTVLPDLQWVANAMDAVLRMTVGAISGVVLMAFIAADAVTISIGAAVFDKTDPKWLYVLIAGFLAGFLERLVPDLLARAIVTDKSPAAKEAAPAEPAAPAGTAGNTAANSAAAAEAGEEDPLPEEADLDCCASDHELAEADATDDADLPVATGGIAPRQA